MNAQALSPLLQLQDSIIACRRCPRLLAYQRQVAHDKVRRFRQEAYWSKPVPSFGDPEARLVIVGLAPAAHGGNRTGRAFTGDRSGAWLYGALHTYGFASQPTSVHRHDALQLHDCYITQVLHCAPPANKPTPQETANCQSYLLTELRLLRQARLLLPLGQIAFAACLRACRALGVVLPTPRPRFGHGLHYQLASDLGLLASYHPSQQNTHTGRLTHQMFHEVFATARALLDGSAHRCC